MKIKITVATWINEELAPAGAEVDLPERDAKGLIEAGRAVEAVAPAPKASRSSKADA